MKTYITILLFAVTICNCYSVPNITENPEEYYGMTFEEFNTTLIDNLDNVNFYIEYFIENINRQITEIFYNQEPNTMTKNFQNALIVELSNMKHYLRAIKDVNNIENRKTNTHYRLDISDILREYRRAIYNIRNLIVEYKNKSSRKTSLRKRNYNKTLLQELRRFLQKRINNKFLENTWDTFYTEYKKYYGPIFKLDDWEIIN